MNDCGVFKLRQESLLQLQLLPLLKFYHEIFNYMPVQVPIVHKQFEFTTLIRSQADYSAAADG